RAAGGGRRRTPRPMRLPLQSRPPRSRAASHGDESSLLSQGVADAAHGVNQPRLPAGLGFPPEVADVDLERVRRRPQVVPPDAVEDHVPRQNLTGVAEEELEQQELGASELDQAISASHVARARVEGQVAERELALATVGPAQQRTQPRQQLLEGKRL